MMHKKLHEALDEIQDRHLSEAAQIHRKPRILWLGTLAAILAAVLLITSLTGPMAVRAEAVSLADAPRISLSPKRDDYEDVNQWRADLDTWHAAQKKRNETSANALSQLSGFFTHGNTEFLSGSEGNQLWSPVNAFLGLSMVAEITGGDSRQQILSLLGTDSIADLRAQSSAIWENAYKDDGHNVTTLANSLWLEDGLPFRQETAEALSHHYYADIYQGDLGSAKINKAIGSWLNNKTGGLLKEATDSISLSQETILALYSTVYFQAKWSDQFQKSNNTQDVFHATSGSKTVTYMNRKLAQMNYYWGDTFSAVALHLENGSAMWFLLPDEGLTPEDVLQDGQYMELFSQNGYKNSKFMKVNLSVPKFDVSGKQNLREGLNKMGVTDIFSMEEADFSPILPDSPAYFTGANQAVRVQIDEEGIKAAAYIEFPAAGSPAPPEEIVDFILNRPFLFMITDSNIPLFAGTVREP